MKQLPALAFSFATLSLLAACPAPQSASSTSQAADGAGAQAAGAPTSQPCTLPTQIDAPAPAAPEAPPQAEMPPAQAGGQAQLPALLAPGEVGHYGAPFTISAEPLSLAQALQMCTNTGSNCKIAATIDRVCQNKGCWFTLAAPDVDRPVRVRMQDYAFFVPRNAMGAAVIAEGVLTAVEEPQELAQHYADDEAAAGTAPARVVTGPVQTYQFLISGVQVTQPDAAAPAE